ncbi:hypothetical protein PG984_003121 [Apiospora sp. TS-2023a]
MISKRLSVSNCAVQLLLSLLFAAQIVFAGVFPPRQDLSALLTDPARQWGKGTIVSLGGSSRFKSVTERWTIFKPPTYFVAVSPSTEEDVRKVTKLATIFKIPFLVMGSRHGYSTSLGKLQNGLSIDLSGIRTMDINKTGPDPSPIGPGIGAGDLFDPPLRSGL